MTELTEMIIVQNDATCCQLLLTPLCLLFKRVLVWVIFAPDRETVSPSPWSEKPLTALLDTADPPFFQ